jgi:hypothetical protein
LPLIATEDGSEATKIGEVHTSLITFLSTSLISSLITKIGEVPKDTSMRLIASDCVRLRLIASDGLPHQVPKDTSVRIMETIVLADGTEKALISKDGVVASPYGWIVTKIPGKAKGEEDQTLLVPATPLPISFNLAVHTANSLMRVLSGKAGKVRARGLHARVPHGLPRIATDCHRARRERCASTASSQATKAQALPLQALTTAPFPLPCQGASVIKRRKDGEGLPSAVAGKRPKFGDQDGPTSSRRSRPSMHVLTTAPPLPHRSDHLAPCRRYRAGDPQDGLQLLQCALRGHQLDR